MDGQGWEPSLSLLEWEVTDKQEQEAGAIDLVVGLELEIPIWIHVRLI